MESLTHKSLLYGFVEIHHEPFEERNEMIKGQV